MLNFWINFTFLLMSLRPEFKGHAYLHRQSTWVLSVSLCGHHTSFSPPHTPLCTSWPNPSLRSACLYKRKKEKSGTFIQIWEQIKFLFCIMRFIRLKVNDTRLAISQYERCKLSWLLHLNTSCCIAMGHNGWLVNNLSRWLTGFVHFLAAVL